MLQGQEYKRLMQARDPVQSKFSHSNNPLNTCAVKMPVALQSGLGKGGTLNKSFSRSSGLRIQDTMHSMIGTSAQKTNIHSVYKFTKDKRPVSSYSSILNK